MKNLQGLLDKIPHWLCVGLAIAAGAFVQNLRDQPDFISAITTWNTANLWKDLQMAAGFTLTAVLAWLRTDPWTANANAAAKAAAAVKVPPLPLLLLLLVPTLTSCITSSPTVTPTPQNANQIASCQQTASLHNGVVIGDMIVGGGATTLGAVAAALPSDQTSTKTDLAITTAALAGVTTIGAGVAALTASNFSNGHCSDVVAPLPMKPGPSPDGGVALLPSFGDLQ
jgi:hypothetical protein